MGNWFQAPPLMNAKKHGSIERYIVHGFWLPLLISSGKYTQEICTVFPEGVFYLVFSDNREVTQ